MLTVTLAAHALLDVVRLSGHRAMGPNLTLGCVVKGLGLTVILRRPWSYCQLVVLAAVFRCPARSSNQPTTSIAAPQTRKPTSQ